MPLFQLLLDSLSSSQHSLKAFRDSNLVFLIYLFFSGMGQQQQLGLYIVGDTVCPLSPACLCPVS